MELTILEENEKPLLKRKEVRARIHFTGETPSRAQVAGELAAKLGCPRDQLLVTRIKTVFGDSAAQVTARCYTDKDAMQAMERENMIAKNAKPEPEPEPEAPAEEASAEGGEEPSADEAEASTDSEGSADEEKTEEDASEDAEKED